ncbi:zinc dependent phospholipase C family protein [Engelhardtia mirabilis]|uniref:Phospholipase C/D domain-containing protein n=1 Tax=Engelhardtia mirabilis TaxID=2528011 RepID=A0A518BNA2_9BACT|nr:hypothetical protein Pla133_35590 [Planctomycetes bacterium Pla133]QDV02787.1 hypothetical protein Pla86_35570 [Planctomycetes bacterium Pla86]
MSLSILLLLALFACAALVRLGWGPGTHLEYASRVHRRRDELPADRAALIDEHRDAYDYGNLAADIINFKAWGGHYNHCHRWTIVDEMRGHAQSEKDEAFCLGYLSHLAADTIAHNHFVPYHLARYARGGKGLGHLFWELNADRFVADVHWQRVAELKGDPDLAALDEMVGRTVAKKALSMKTNKLVFNHVLLVSERDAWRAQMERVLPQAKVGLAEDFLERFRTAATERVLLALQYDGVPQLNHIDTNGKAAQAAARKNHRAARWVGIGAAGRADERAHRAESFLEGMQSPPPDADAPAHW